MITESHSNLCDGASEPSNAQWDSIVERGASADGTFVYAVRTTGIFCNPSCPAKTPRRENVRIFADPNAASDAGFRACLRCKPNHGQSHANIVVERACRFIDEQLSINPDCRLTLDVIAAAVGLSRGHLQRTFTGVVGVSPKAYVDAKRTALAKAALLRGDSVLSATLEGGFNSGKALYERAADSLGMTPGKFRKGGAGLTIRYAVFDSGLGSVLIAATTNGICAVALGDSAEALVEKLCSDFAAATIVRDDEQLGAWAEPVLRFIAAAPGDSLTDCSRQLLQLPVDIRGTVFQRRVWNALRTIPVGETRSYKEVAEMLGAPASSRAVARACASNDVALVVPCHRVIGADGRTRGYRWGEQRKSDLLKLEADA